MEGANLITPESYQTIGWVSMSLASMAVGANHILRLVDRTKEKPIPSETYATIRDHERLSLRVDQISGEIKDGFIKIDEKRSRSVAGIYDELREIAGKVNTTSERSETARAALASLSGKIDHLIEEVGQLKGRSE